MTDAVVVVMVIALAVISRAVAVRLWRSGRINDRALMILTVARFPVVVFVFGLIVGAAIPLLIVLVAGSVVLSILLHRIVLGDLTAYRDTP